MGLADLLPSSDESEDEIVVEQSGSFNDLVTRSSLSGIDSVRPYCKTLPKLLDGDTDALDSAKQESWTIYNFIKLNYKPVWPDLDRLITLPKHYARVIALIGGDIAKVEVLADEFGTFLKKDEVLGLTMSASVMKRANQEVDLTKYRLDLILEACEVLLELEAARDKIQEGLVAKAVASAPNVTAIVGSTVCAQLLATYGLQGLCQVPSCNLVSGNLSSCELVQTVGADYRKKAARHVAAKVVLAARIDSSHPTSSDFGKKWHDQIAEKMDRIQAPPDLKKSQPLPKPVPTKSAKRGGRRFRKQKQRLEMSEVEKAQNRMAFGQKEHTHMDSYGDEIGLGMVGKGTYRALTVSEAHKPQLTKRLGKELERFGNGRGPKGEIGSKGDVGDASPARKIRRISHTETGKK